MTPYALSKRPAPGTGWLGGALTALLLPALPAVAQTLTNPGFEQDSFSGTVADHTPITGWTTTTPALVGLNAHADNGTIPDDSTGVAFLATGGVLKTTVGGLTPGIRYHVAFRVNAAVEGSQTIGEGNPFLVFSTDASSDPLDRVGTKVNAVQGSAAYRHAGYEFTATGSSHELTLANTRTTGTHFLLVDSLSVVPSINAWSVSPWTGDADSGIDSSYAYTHALNFNLAGGVTVNGVPFMGATTAIMETSVGGRITVGPLGGSTTFAAPNLPQLTGNSLSLARNLRGGSLTFSLENLKPNTQYVASFYLAGMDDPVPPPPPSAVVPELYRSATFSSFESAQKLTVDQSRYGYLKGMIIRHTYTTDISGTATISVNPLSPVGPRLGAFSNREAATFSGTTGWTHAQWIDDASAGIDTSYHYTHAYKFNSATSPVVNGLTFKGLTGDNPIDTPGGFITSRLTGSATNPGTNITGTSAELATTYHGSVATGTPSSYILTGLTPGKEYVCTLYSVGWTDTRPVCLYATAGGKPAVIDQKQYGEDNGIRLEYRYVAPDSGIMAISSSAYDSTKLFHAYALSNREAQVSAVPSITSHPASANIPAGFNHTLQVGATGSPVLTYEWFYNGDLIPGATASSYTLVAPGYDRSGDYTVKVTNPNGNVTSTAASITVQDAVPGLFNTGTGWDGQVLWDGSGGAVIKDPHYKLVQNPDSASQDTFVQTTVPVEWLQSDEQSQWIGPRPFSHGSAGEATYVYRLQFALKDFDRDSVVISGRWACDDAATGIFLNGTFIGFSFTGSGNSYTTLKPFQIDAALLQTRGATLHTDGTPNTLDFGVSNLSSFTGLMVRDLKGTGSIIGNIAPHIITGPASAGVNPGTTVTLGVVASGSAVLTYQWQKDGNDIPGATQSYLSIPVSGSSDEGEYRVVVTNSFGSATSAVAVITGEVAAGEPTEITLSFSDGVVTGSFHGTPGATYRVERSTTLAPGSWEEIQTSQAPPSGIVAVSDDDAPEDRAFYRIVYTP